MREKNIFIKGFEDIKTLHQYLYMNENHFIEAKNPVTTLKIRMNENGFFLSKNLNFPELPELSYTAQMTITNMLAIISQLKTQSSNMEYFETKWEEIKEIVSSSITLSFVEE